MDKAYDSILCAEIDAISLAKTSFHKQVAGEQFQFVFNMSKLSQ